MDDWRDEMMTRKEAAAYLRISVRQLERNIANNRIVVIQAYPGATVWISRIECDRYLKIREN